MDINAMTGEEYYSYFKLCASCKYCTGLAESGYRQCTCANQETVDTVREYCPDYVHDPKYTMTDDNGAYIGSAPKPKRVSAPVPPAEENWTPVMPEYDEEDGTRLFKFGKAYASPVRTEPQPEYVGGQDEEEDDEPQTGSFFTRMPKPALILMVAGCVIALVVAILLISHTLKNAATPIDRGEEQTSDVVSPAPSDGKKKDERTDTTPAPSTTPKPEKKEKDKKLISKLNGVWTRYERTENRISVETITFNSADGTYDISRYSYVNDMYYGRRPEGSGVDIWYIDDTDEASENGMFTVSDAGELNLSGGDARQKYVNVSESEGLYIDGKLYVANSTISDLSAAAKKFGLSLEPDKGKYDNVSRALDGMWTSASRNGDSITVTTFEFDYSNGTLTKTKSVYNNKSVKPSDDKADSDGWYCPEKNKQTIGGYYSVSGEAALSVEFTRDSSIPGSFNDVTVLSFKFADDTVITIDGVAYLSGAYGASIRELASLFHFSADAPVSIAKGYSEKVASAESYRLADIDGDGVQELITLTGMTEAEKIFTIYTFKDQKVITLGSVSGEHRDLYGVTGGGLYLVLCYMDAETITSLTVSGNTLREELVMEPQEIGEYTVPDDAYSLIAYDASDLSAIAALEN